MPCGCHAEPHRISRSAVGLARLHSGTPLTPAPPTPVVGQGDTVILTLDPSSDLPPFEQLRVQVIDAVMSGRLGAGAKLPTVRRLADELGIAANTVARSYRELERAGYIETRGRNGSTVAARNTASQEGKLAADIFARRTGELRIPAEEALALARSALQIPSQQD